MISFQVLPGIFPQILDSCVFISLLQIMPDSAVPKVLILGHSFVKRLSRDIQQGLNTRMDANFGLQGTAAVKLYGQGGRTVRKCLAYDLDVVRNFSPEVVILEVGTNDLTELAPEVVGSAIDDLVHLILDRFPVRMVCW